MAILFQEKKKREIYLGVLAIVLILVSVFFWFKFLRKDTNESSVSEPAFLEKRGRQIQIDFEKIQNQILQDLESFSPIFSVEQNFGRKNPFTVYTGTSSVSDLISPEE